MTESLREDGMRHVGAGQGPTSHHSLPLPLPGERSLRAHAHSQLDELLAGRIIVTGVRPLAGGVELCGARVPASSGVSVVSEPRERRLLELAAKGASGVYLALEFGLSEATISRRLERVLASVGLQRGTAAVAWRMLAAHPPSLAAAWRIRRRIEGPADWSDSERSVALLSLAGLGPRDIALLRATSTGTVRAQLRSAAKKGKCAHWLELGAAACIAFDSVDDGPGAAARHDVPCSVTPPT